MWDYLESLEVGIRREDPLTWDNIPTNEYGILLQFGIGQSPAMWHVRTLPNVHKYLLLLGALKSSSLTLEELSTGL